MFRILRVQLPEELDAVHEFGHACRDVVVAVEPDCAVCYCFGSIFLGEVSKWEFEGKGEMKRTFVYLACLRLR